MKKTSKKKATKKPTSKKTPAKKRKTIASHKVEPDELSRKDLLKIISKGRGRKRIHKEMRAEKILVTPALAKQWLENNFNSNRDITWSRVVFFKNLILKGKFKCIAQGLTFSWFGDLMDGQHRLHGVIEANTPVEMWVVVGEDPANFYLYDDHRPRSVGDVLSTVGVKHGGSVAAIFKKVLDLVKTSPEGYSAIGHRKWSTYNKAQAIAWATAEENKAVLFEISEYLKAKKDLQELRTAPSILGALYYIFWQVNPKDTREFFASLRDGANLSATSPIHWCRKTLITLRDDFKRKYWQAPPQFVYPSVIIRAWNDWRAGRRVREKYPIQRADQKFPVIDMSRRRKAA